MESNSTNGKKIEEVITKRAANVKTVENATKEAGTKNVVTSKAKETKHMPSKRIGAGTKVIVATVVGFPIAFVAGMKLSPNFFERCEREYPNAVGFIRKYVPLHWPLPISKKEDIFIPVSMSSKELESEIAELLKTTETEVDNKNKEDIKPISEIPEKIEESMDDLDDSYDMDVEHVISVLAAARLLLESEDESLIEQEKHTNDIVNDALKTVYENEKVEEDDITAISVEKSITCSVEEIEEVLPVNDKITIIETSLITPMEADKMTTKVLLERIESIQLQLCEIRNQENKRCIDLLTEQKEVLEDEVLNRIVTVEKEVREEIEKKEKEEVETYRNSIKAKYDDGMSRMNDLYHSSLTEYLTESKYDMYDDQSQMEKRVEKEWKEKTENRVRSVSETMSGERKTRIDELKALHTQLKGLIQRVQSHQDMMTEIEQNQEFQKSLIQLQSDIISGKPLKEDISSLGEKGKDDIILVHLISRIPESVKENGVLSLVYYYNKFHNLHKEARVASKIPDNTGFAGQLIGRTVVALVGNDGLSDDDAIIKLEKVNGGDLEKAYEIASEIEGGAAMVLEPWMKELKDRLEFDRIMQQIRLHIERNDE